MAQAKCENLPYLCFTFSLCTCSLHLCFPLCCFLFSELVLQWMEKKTLITLNILKHRYNFSQLWTPLTFLAWRRMVLRLIVLAYGFSLIITLKFFRGFFLRTLRWIFFLKKQVRGIYTKVALIWTTRKWLISSSKNYYYSFCQDKTFIEAEKSWSYCSMTWPFTLKTERLALTLVDAGLSGFLDFSGFFQDLY